MYYNGKTDFYFKQYILPVMAIVISICLISTGAYIYWASISNNANKQNLVTASNEPVKEEVKEKVVENNEISEEKVDDLKQLPSLELSKTGKVTKINDNATITFYYNNTEYNLTLIGINTENALSNLTDTLKNDLLNKDVKIAFDNNKSDGKNTYAYVYLYDKLYNEYLLENGIATLKKEQLNTTYMSDLTQAQAYAKQLDNGIWAD